MTEPTSSKTLHVASSHPLGAVTAEEAFLLEKLNLGRLPKHLAVIMDGNGRWAKQRLLPRVAGHRRGVEAVRATVRACIERGRVWQAEHYVGAVRDHALSLACLRQGLPAVQARGYDDLSAENLARFEGAHVRAVEPWALRAALATSVLALMGEGAEAGLPHAHTVAQRLAEFR